MKRFSAATRISIGITCLTLSLLLAAQGLGVIPNTTEVTIKGRKQLCETLAIQCSLAAQRDAVAEIESAAKSIAQRDPEVLSVGLRRADGEVLVRVGEHEKQWASADKAK